MAFVKGKSLNLSFAADFVSTDQDVADLQAGRPPAETRWCLLELPEEQLKELEAGEKFHIKEQSGSSEAGAGPAVLCSPTKTFSLEFLENSNSIFIAAGSDESHEVFAQCRGQIIVNSTIPDAQRVRELLTPFAFGQAAVPAALLSTRTLEHQVAASPQEFKALLAAGPYVEHEGGWRMISAALEREVVDLALNVLVAQQWNPESVDGEALLHEVRQHLGQDAEASLPSLAVLHKALRGVLAGAAALTGNETTAKDTSMDTAAASESQSGSGMAEAAAAGGAGAGAGHLWRFDKGRMARFRALHLLRETPSQVRERFQLPAPGPRPKRPRIGSSATAGAGGREAALQLHELVKAFQELQGSDCSENDLMEILGDSAYVDEFEGTVHSLSTVSLPQRPNERLVRLFELQSHWRPERMERLIAPCMGAGVKTSAWLLKWTRAVFVELEPGNEQRMLVKKFAGI